MGEEISTGSHGDEMERGRDQYFPYRIGERVAQLYRLYRLYHYRKCTDTKRP
jgi:hypothetical protein